MSSWAGRLCALAACLLCVGCGRIGVSPIDVLIPPDEVDPGPEPLEDAAGSADASEAYALDAASDAELPPTQAVDAAEPLDVLQPAVFDASADAGLDASTDAQETSVGAQDSAAEASVADVSAPACDGASALGLCWYLGAEDRSCREVCTSHGGFDSRAVALVGTREQGGSADNCSAVLAVLGYTGTVGEGMRADMLGIGCHRWDADAWWIVTNADFNQDAHGDPARIACACLR